MAITWPDYLKEKSSPFEKKFLGEEFKERTILVRALTRNAVLNEKLEHKEMKSNGSQDGLDTIGDTVLDFIILDHFSRAAGDPDTKCTPEELNSVRETYGKNLNLHKFSRDE